MEQGEKFDSWGIVEVMGHKKFAGHITEQTIAGSALIRVDVPAVKIGERDLNPFSKLIGVGSVYCITPTTEEVARKAAEAIARHDSDPLPVYIPETRQIPAATDAVTVPSDDDDDDGYDPF